jgi:uncharacterized DUF497 family protein
MGRSQESGQHPKTRRQLRNSETHFRPAWLTSPDRRKNYGEDRYVSIGQVGHAALIVVAHTRRDGRIRLISARPASRKERQKYHEELQ